MRSSNVHLFGEWFFGVEGWIESKGPYHLLPSIVWVTMEDLDLNVRGTSLSFLLWNKALKKWHRVLDDRQHQISDDSMECILDEMQRKHGWTVEPDAAKIRDLVSKTPWLRQIYANGGDRNSYAIGVVSNMLKQKALETKDSSLSLDALENNLVH
jgi:hypothetical protein